MGFLSSVGVESNPLGVFSSEGLLFWGGLIFLAFVILVVSGAAAFFYYGNKAKKKSFKNTIPIYISLNGKHQKVGTDNAKEIYVPDSNISLFYLKINKIYTCKVMAEKLI